MFGYITSDIDNLQVRTSLIIFIPNLNMNWKLILFTAVFTRLLCREQGQGFRDPDGDLQGLQGGDEAAAGQGDHGKQDGNTKEEGRSEQAQEQQRFFREKGL